MFVNVFGFNFVKIFLILINFFVMRLINIFVIFFVLFGMIFCYSSSALNGCFFICVNFKNFGKNLSG